MTTTEQSHDSHMTALHYGTHIRFIAGGGLSKVDHQFKHLVCGVTLEDAHGVIQQLLRGVHLVTSKGKGNRQGSDRYTENARG